MIFFAITTLLAVGVLFLMVDHVDRNVCKVLQRLDAIEKLLHIQQTPEPTDRRVKE